MIDIIVAGYPKSGTTWLTRLVAELAGCPVSGYYNSNHDEIAREGLDRKSDFQCFKSHHQLGEILNIKSNPGKIIYIIRDPRDICISGYRFFKICRFPLLKKYTSLLPGGEGIYKKIDQLITSPDYRMDRMVKAVLYGSRDIDQWVCIPWADHYKPYMSNGYLILKYEDLLNQPVHECNRIASFLELQLDNKLIQSAIDKQSFKAKKTAYIEAGDIRNMEFMKTGKSRQWIESLPQKHKDLFIKKIGHELAQLGYESS